MSSNQKRGFRLPWGAERPSEDGTGAATLERLDAADEGDDGIGTGPFRLAEQSSPSTAEAAPAATDQPDTSSEAAMIDSKASTSESQEAPPAVDADASPGWPTTDRPSASGAPATARPATKVEGEARPARRENPLVAGLVKAMREAAIASRAETTARLQAEASARVEAIRAGATTETAALRKRADEDVSEIREWSKIELARVRQATEDRIEARKAELTAEIERHASTVEQLVEQVQTTVSAFEADMDRFFEQLLAENDPAKLAGLAERAPEPPDLVGDAPSGLEASEPTAVASAEPAATAAAAPTAAAPAAEPELEPAAEAGAETVAGAAQPAGSDAAPSAEPGAGLQADAAAEAEAAASEGLDPNASETWPTVTPAATRGDVPAAPLGDANGPDSTRLLVHGLTSVAQISSFKGGLASLRGVRSVSVSSGERGVFIFTVHHDPGVDLDSGVASLTTFRARVTDATDDGFTVSVGEGAA